MSEYEHTTLETTADELSDLHILLREAFTDGMRAGDGEVVEMQVEVPALMCGLVRLKDAIDNLRWRNRVAEARALAKARAEDALHG